MTASEDHKAVRCEGCGAWRLRGRPCATCEATACPWCMHWPIYAGVCPTCWDKGYA